MKRVVTGAQESGKSTRLRAWMAEAGWKAPAGFRTWWEGDRRDGGKLMVGPWDGAWAEEVGERGRLDGAKLAAAALRALDGVKAGERLVIDELGVLEAGDEALRRRVEELWAAAEEGILVVQERALGAWRGLGEAGSLP
jgi:hypothetical protein